MGLTDEVVDVFVAHLSGGEGGQQVDGPSGGLDQRDVSRRQRGRRSFGGLLPGEGAGTRTDEPEGGQALPGGGCYRLPLPALPGLGVGSGNVPG